MADRGLVFSVIVPTYNSAKTLAQSLASIRAQSFDQKRIEILVVDGGSTDATLDIAREYGARIVPNPRRLPEIAKFVGIGEAKGELIVFADSDEVTRRTDAFAVRARAFERVPNAHTLATEGYTRPVDCPPLVDYYNLIGDAFSYFVNRKSIVVEYASRRFHDRYTTRLEDPDFYALEVKPHEAPPMFDAGGHTFRRATLLEVAKSNFETGDVTCIGAISSMLSRHSGVFLVTRDDFINHYTDASVTMILKKTQFRIISNLFMAQSGSNAAGYVERERYLPTSAKRRKYLFIPYAFSVVLPTVDGIAMSMRHKNPSFMWHPVFAVATASMIGWYVAKGALGQAPTMSSYGKG